MPVETMSTARMLRSDPCAWVSACFAASSVDVFEEPTNSMIFTTANFSSFAHAAPVTGGIRIGCAEVLSPRRR
jgi:hypothetical protein